MAADKKSIATDRTIKTAHTKSIAAYKRAAAAHKSFVADCNEICGCLQEVYIGPWEIYGDLRHAEADRAALLADQVIRKPNYLLLD